MQYATLQTLASRPGGPLRRPALRRPDAGLRAEKVRAPRVGRQRVGVDGGLRDERLNSWARGGGVNNGGVNNGGISDGGVSGGGVNNGGVSDGRLVPPHQRHQLLFVAARASLGAALPPPGSVGRRRHHITSGRRRGQTAGWRRQTAGWRRQTAGWRRRVPLMRQTNAERRRRRHEHGGGVPGGIDCGGHCNLGDSKRGRELTEGRVHQPANRRPRRHTRIANVNGFYRLPFANSKQRRTRTFISPHFPSPYCFAPLLRGSTLQCHKLPPGPTRPPSWCC